MNHRLRKPALMPSPPPPAEALRENPAERLAAMYRHIGETRMAGLPFLNTALQVEAVGFRQWRGDWVGALITPWFLNLFILPGGGELWSDEAAGERSRVIFPAGEIEFIADHEASTDIPAYQYCPLFAPPSRFTCQEEARAAAEAALTALFSAPEVSPTSPPEAARPPTPAPEAQPSRRNFLRRLAGKGS